FREIHCPAAGHAHDDQGRRPGGHDAGKASAADGSGRHRDRWGQLLVQRHAAPGKSFAAKKSELFRHGSIRRRRRRALRPVAEAYDLLRKVLGLSAGEIADIFAKWDQGPLNSFLIEITSQVLSVRDPKDGKPLVDHILDKAGQKGTGKWTAQVALDLAVAIPTIAAAIDARVLSSMKDQRLTASQKFKGPSAKYSGSKQELIAAVHDALYASKICSYAQGMSLIQAGSDEYKWNISLKEMARIWKGGCIIRALFLDDIMRAFDKQ